MASGAVTDPTAPDDRTCQERPMTSIRKTALVAGVLYVVTLVGLAGSAARA
jgi:hypothetical protein